LKTTNTEEHVIDMYASHMELKSQVDRFWNSLYTGESIKDIFADDDGKIFYTTETLSSK